MNIAIIGAGTIGITYAWLLSQDNSIDVLIKETNLTALHSGFRLEINDLSSNKKSKEYITYNFSPNLITEINNNYDLIIIAVNRYQLIDILPQLKRSKGTAILLFLQNHWNIELELLQYFSHDDYVLGFPSTVGGGRNENVIQTIVFDAPTRLSASADSQKIHILQKAFAKSKIKTVLQRNFIAWQKTHYLQQGVTAGAILQAGTYEKFATDFAAIKKMLIAYKEGIAVCKALGVNTKSFFPSNMLYLPLPFLTIMFKAFFNQPLTFEMIQGHMKNGLAEWIYGYYEIIFTGKDKNILMENWLFYKPFVDEYCEKNHLLYPF